MRSRTLIHWPLTLYWENGPDPPPPPFTAVSILRPPLLRYHPDAISIQTNSPNCPSISDLISILPPPFQPCQTWPSPIITISLDRQTTSPRLQLQSKLDVINCTLSNTLYPNILHTPIKFSSALLNQRSL